MTVLGGGAWGTAIATVLAHNGFVVHLWCFEQDVVDDILQHRMNKRYLPGIELHQNIMPTSCMHEALEASSVVFEAIPIVFLREVLVQAKELVSEKKLWVLLSKGIENETLFFPSQVLHDVVDDTCKVNTCQVNTCKVNDCVVLSGPNFAHQVATRVPSAIVLASTHDEHAHTVRDMLTCDYIIPEVSTDVMGVQVCGALKNVISLFVGMARGAGYKENTVAALLVRGLAEMAKLVEHYEGEKDTAYGISGLGDLVLGFVGEKNRNYEIGILIGQGTTLHELEESRGVLPEGINAIRSLYGIVKDMNLPICKEAYRVIYEDKPMQDLSRLL